MGTARLPTVPKSHVRYTPYWYTHPPPLVYPPQPQKGFLAFQSIMTGFYNGDLW